MIVPSPLFRPDPTRAVYVDGLIDDKLLTRLTPLVLRLQAANRKPITVYIVDSPGGSTTVMQGILRLLRLSDKSGGKACRLITVVTTKAQSAAADLLSSGDYAIAHPGCSLLYHGVRTPTLIPTLQPLTAERTSLLAQLLRITNDAFAMQLARKAEDRFVFRFIMSMEDIDKYRQEHKGKKLSDVDCFVEVLSPKLSAGAVKVLKKAHERYAKYEPLLTKFTSKPGRRTRTAKEEATRIKAIVDFEVASNKANTDWTFKAGGMSRLVEDFFLVAEYLESQESERLDDWCKMLGKVHLKQEEYSEIDKIADEQAKSKALVSKVRPLVGPLWSFFVALCHALQEDENELTATDAYWLGLVDEVFGETSLPTTRWFAEWQPDPKPPEPPPTQAEEKNKEQTEPKPEPAAATAGHA